MNRIYRSDEDKMMQDKTLTWSEPLVINNDKKKHNHLMATDWNYAIKEHIKTGLESPIPYKVIPYKNGIGIKKIVFFKPIKNNSL